MKSKDITFFEAALIERKEQLMLNIQKVSTEIEESKGAELKDDGDMASANGDFLINDAIVSQQKKEYEEIEYALSKIKRGNYGTCEMCEEPIGMSRLKATPFARYCIVCREIVEKESKRKDGR